MSRFDYLADGRAESMPMFAEPARRIAKKLYPDPAGMDVVPDGYPENWEEQRERAAKYGAGVIMALYEVAIIHNLPGINIIFGDELLTPKE